MRIVIFPNTENPDLIEGICNIPGWTGESSVISFRKVSGKWTVASSMAIPSDIEQARKVKNCFDEAFEVLKEYMHPRVNTVKWTLRSKEGLDLAFYLGISKPEKGQTIFDKHPELVKGDCYLVPVYGDEEAKKAYQIDDEDSDCVLVPKNSVEKIEHEVIYCKPDGFWIMKNSKGKAGEPLS